MSVDAFYINTLERIHEAIKGSVTDEQRLATVYALANVTSTMLFVANNKEYDKECLDMICKRILDVNLEPQQIETVNEQTNLYEEVHTKILNEIKTEMLTSKDKYYAVLCALSAIMARLLIFYRTDELNIKEEQLFRVMYRFLDTNTK